MKTAITESGRTCFVLRNGMLLDEGGRTLCSLKGNKIVDASGATLYTLRNGDLRSPRGETLPETSREGAGASGRVFLTAESHARSLAQLLLTHTSATASDTRVEMRVAKEARGSSLS